ncbi:MAG: NUDIX hydrolase [Actinomycetales bacterium]
MPPTPVQAGLRAAYLTLLDARPDALRRDGPARHLTGSALVLDEDRSATLLVHHRKAGFWMQPGGHWEPGDASLLATAVREVREETGLEPGPGALPRILDLHTHDLAAAFGRCRTHLDVMFLLITRGRPEPVLSPESRDVRWFPLDALPEGIVPDLPERIEARPGRGG